MGFNYIYLQLKLPFVKLFAGFDRLNFWHISSKCFVLWNNVVFSLSFIQSSKLIAGGTLVVDVVDKESEMINQPIL